MAEPTGMAKKAAGPDAARRGPEKKDAAAPAPVQKTAKVRRGSWVVIVPLAVIAAAYVWFFYLPGSRAIDELREQVKTKQSYIDEAATLNDALRKENQELEEAKKYVAARQQRIPEEKDLGVAFGKVHETANKARVRITKFDPQAPVVYERLRRVPVTVGCTGSFAQVHEFLRTLEEMPLTIWVESIRMEKDQKSGRDVTCELSLGIFAGNSEISGYASNSN